MMVRLKRPKRKALWHAVRGLFRS